jgi:hypothetical protein
MFSCKVRLNYQIRPVCCTVVRDSWVTTISTSSAITSPPPPQIFLHSWNARDQTSGCHSYKSAALRPRVRKYRVKFPGRGKTYVLLQSVKTDAGAQLSSYSVGNGGPSLGIRRPGHETDHPSVSNVEVRNEWSNTFFSLPVAQQPIADKGRLVIEVSRAQTIHTTVGRTFLDQWSTSRRDLRFTIYNNHKRHSSSWGDFFFFFLYSLVLRTSSVLLSVSWLSCILPFCLYLQHITQTSMSPAGFEPSIPASDGPQTLILDRSVTGIDEATTLLLQITSKRRSWKIYLYACVGVQRSNCSS